MFHIRTRHVPLIRAEIEQAVWVGLYASLGFAVAEPISFNPVPGASFLGLRL